MANKGHGRLERRTLTATPVLQKYLADWPGIAQVVQVQRMRQWRGQVEEEVSYGITSLAPQRAEPARLLELNRGHWQIENNRHGVRDVTLGEDGCRVRSGSAPPVLAGLRNAVVPLLHGAHGRGLAAALRRFAAKPLEAAARLFERVKH